MSALADLPADLREPLLLLAERILRTGGTTKVPGPEDHIDAPTQGGTWVAGWQYESYGRGALIVKQFARVGSAEYELTWPMLRREVAAWRGREPGPAAARDLAAANALLDQRRHSLASVIARRDDPTHPGRVRGKYDREQVQGEIAMFTDLAVYARDLVAECEARAAAPGPATNGGDQLVLA